MGVDNIKGIKIGKLALNISSSGVVLSKEGHSNHITFCINERLNAFDIHIKDQSTNIIKQQIYIPVQKLEEFAIEFQNQKHLLSKLFIPTRPGWLNHHGFYITFQESEHIKKLFINNSEIKKRKIMPNVKNILNDLKYLYGANIYYASVLHTLINYKLYEPILAFGYRKSNKHKRYILYCLNLSGRYQWVAFPVHKYKADDIWNIIPVMRNLKKSVIDIFNMINNEFNLRELKELF